ncbi:unnamed protein product [Rhizophagus irregularis]|nr:unnamed protein product [Rhizophagus irregularis]
MSATGRTTRSATRQENNTDPGDTMQGVIKTIPPRNTNSFVFDYAEEEFQVVKSRANKRKERKTVATEKRNNKDTVGTNMKGQKPPIRLVHTYVPYEILKNSNALTKKTVTSKPPVDKTMGKTVIAPPLNQQMKSTNLDAKNGKKYEEINPIISDQPDMEKINAQPTVADQSTPTMVDQEGPGPSTLQGIPEIEMGDEEFKPISIEKKEAFKLYCVIPEGEGSAQFCNFIIKAVKSKVDVLLVVQEKKSEKDGTKFHMITVKVNTNEDIVALELLEFKMPKDGQESETYKFKMVENIQAKK